MSARMKGGANLAKYLTELKQNATSARRVDVGFFRDATYPDGTSVATVAAVQEFGNDRVPARSFMRTTVAERSRQWPGAAAAVLRATGCNARQAMETMGQVAAQEMQSKISEITEPPLAASTVKQREKKGSERPDKPLIDTATMINSLRYQVDPSDD
ncbi:hypothetical protein [Bombella apis]|uniref:hypothetical protein n=1 Tax=Bombella apis TaxID=1785988 RepID=UPI0012B96BFE|nr:hypothetical protein [Bombella apis]MPV99821.1 hypothetical protein [Bombella apis]